MDGKADQEEKELLCIFLGLEFYTSPKKARLLKSKVTSLLLQNLSAEDLVAVQTEHFMSAVDLTPTFSKIKAKLKKG